MEILRILTIALSFVASIGLTVAAVLRKSDNPQIIFLFLILAVACSMAMVQSFKNFLKS